MIEKDMFSALPKRSSAKGFTLIELMVAVSIIAILAVIGLTVYQGVQQRARDARRKSDMDSISKALEVNYSETTAAYLPLATTMFSAGQIPRDPLATATNCSGLVCKYCWRTTGATLVSNCAGTDLEIGPPPASATVSPGSGGNSYTICANLEQSYVPTSGGTAITYYCRTNQR
jgi:prepilin-type N-terminal cleavage/methylation domain-containing protein